MDRRAKANPAPSGRNVFRLYLALLVVATLLFGAVHAYAYSLVFLGVLAGGMGILVRSVQRDVRGGEPVLVLPRNAGLVLFLGLGIWMGFQMVPLPQGLVQRLSPQALVVGRMALPAADAIAAGSDPPEWMTLAPYVYPVRMSLMRWLVYGVFYLGLLRLVDSRNRMETLLMLMLVVGCAESLYGIFEAFSGQSSVLWHPQPRSEGLVTGTFVNRNHFAAYAGAVLVMTTAGIAGAAVRKRERPAIAGGRLRSRLAGTLAGEQVVSKRAFMLAAGGALGLGLVLSASRGGILAGGFGLLSLGVLLSLRRGFRRRGLVILLLCLVIASYALQTGVAFTEERFRRMEIGVGTRLEITRSVLEIFKSYPWVGVGVGNFQYAFPRVQPGRELRGYYRYGHNDWAQFLAEAGLFGAVVFLSGFGWLLFRLLSSWRRRHHPFAVCAGAGGVAVLLATVFHASVEFHLHIPGVFLTMCAVLAMAHGAVHLETGRGGERSHRGVFRVPWKRGRWVALGISAMIVLNGVWMVRHLVAETYCGTVPNSTLNRDAQPGLEEIRKAVLWDGGNAAYWFKLAQALMLKRDAAVQAGADKRVPVLQEDVIEALEEAIRRNPLDGHYHLRLAWEYARLWRRPDYHSLWLPAADLSMERAAYFAGDKHPDMHQEMGVYWTMRSKTLSPGELTHHAAWARACWHYGRALGQVQGEALDRLREEIRGEVWRFYPDESYVEAALGSSR